MRRISLWFGSWWNKWDQGWTFLKWSYPPSFWSQDPFLTKYQTTTIMQISSQWSVSYFFKMIRSEAVFFYNENKREYFLFPGSPREWALYAYEECYSVVPLRVLQEAKGLNEILLILLNHLINATGTQKTIQSHSWWNL